MTQKQAALFTVIALAVVLGIAAFFIGKAFTDNLLLLLLYALVAAIAVIGVRAWAPRAKKSKCPNCGRAMMTKDRVVLPGGTNLSDSTPLPAILERRFLCQQCNYRYHEIVEAAEAPEEYWALHKEEQKPTLTVDEWTKIKDEALQAAELKNKQPADKGNKWMF